MASPKKVNSIRLSATTLSDPDLPVVELNKTDLINFLNTVTSSQVVLFFEGEGSDNGTLNRLVIAELGTDGNPSSSKQFQSASLPCPPYCQE